MPDKPTCEKTVAELRAEAERLRVRAERLRMGGFYEHPAHQRPDEQRMTDTEEGAGDRTDSPQFPR